MRQGNATLLSLAPVTMSLLAINTVLFFIAGNNSGSFNIFSGEVLTHLGSLNRELLWEGEWVRIVAPIFLHVGLMHFIMNSLALYQLGPSAEVHFGSSNFGTLYLLSGIVGVCFSSMFSIGRAAGASGAIFGIMASQLAVEVIKSPVLKYAFRRSQVRTAFIWLLIYFMIGVSGAMGRVDNWGHFGGIVGGLLLGGLFELWRTRRQLGFGLVIGALLLIAGLICVTRWSVFNPSYHIHQAWLAEEQGRSDEMAHEYEEARQWGKTWKKSDVVEGLIRGHDIKLWGLDQARGSGYTYLNRAARALMSQNEPDSSP